MKRWHIKKIIALITLAALVSTYGCAKQPARQKPSEIVVWHWISDRIDAFDELAKQYKAETGIPVKFELYAPTDAYTSKVRAAAQANKLPDIYGVLMEMKDFASFINAGHVADLTSAMDADNGLWQNTFYKGGLLMNTFLPDNQYGVKPGIYGVPLDINNIQLLYNTELLKKAGWDPAKLPSTWSEFIALGDMLKKARIPGLVSGWGEIWMVHCFADNYAWNIMGKDAILATIRGEIPYTDPRWVQVFDLFKQMKDRGLLADGIVTMVNKEAEQSFSNERAAMAFNGSWGVNVYEGMNPELQYTVALPPRINLSNPMYIWGGTTSFVVNEKSPVKAETIAFLKWLSSEKQQTYLAQATRNLPANRNCAGAIATPLAQFSKGMDNVVHPRLLPIEEFPLVTEAFDKGIQSIIIGEATPQEIAGRVQEVKEREKKRREKQQAQNQTQ